MILSDNPETALRDLSPKSNETAGPASGVTVTDLYRYPVKGLSPQACRSLAVTAADGLALDRRFALALGSTIFDPSNPEPLDKSFFLMLRRDEKLAALTTRFEVSSGELTIEPPDGATIVANVETQDGRRIVEDFFHAYIGESCNGRPRLVEAARHKFTDVSVVSPAMMRAVSLINLASVRDLATRCGSDLDPLRFRANIHIDGLAPWAELDWVGQDVTIGTARFRCVLRTKRCAAIDVDPRRGLRDTRLPKALVTNYGHPDCGIYLETSYDGDFGVGDGVTVQTRDAVRSAR